MLLVAVVVIDSVGNGCWWLLSSLCVGCGCRWLQVVAIGAIAVCGGGCAVAVGDGGGCCLWL